MRGVLYLIMGKLKDVLGLKNNDCVSIVGAGGKTTLMFKLAKELSDERVCVTTTTKIFMPKRDEYDYLCHGKTDARTFRSETPGVHVIAGPLNNQNKLTSLDEVSLSRCYDNFDYLLIESDGSKGRSIKGWNGSEPVIYSRTTKTVCILDITILLKTISEDTVFRLDEFKKVVKANEGDVIEIKHLAQLANHSNGLLKNSQGERILFINKVEAEDELQDAIKLVSQVISSCDDNRCCYDRIIIGSLKNEEYYLSYDSKDISTIVLASGSSTRMGKNKLLMNFNGINLVEHVLKKIEYVYFHKKMITICDQRLNDISDKYGIASVNNKNYNLGQSESIKLGILNSIDADAHMFFVGDQPFIKSKTILKMVSKYLLTDKIIMCRCEGRFGNPAIFPSRYKDELLTLNGDVGAKAIIDIHKDEIEYVEVEEVELYDIDTLEEYENLKG